MDDEPKAAEIPPVILVTLRVILNHVEPGWENCTAVLREWLEAETNNKKDKQT